MAEIATLRTPAEATFDVFWALYPRKVAKRTAVKAWKRALRDTSPAEIIAGLRRYLEHLPDSVQYVLHPATYLNGARWEDEYEDEVKAKTGAELMAELDDETRTAH